MNGVSWFLVNVGIQLFNGLESSGQCGDESLMKGLYINLWLQLQITSTVSGVWYV